MLNVRIPRRLLLAKVYFPVSREDGIFQQSKWPVKSPARGLECNIPIPKLYKQKTKLRRS
jgi:hypothetical protein